MVPELASLKTYYFTAVKNAMFSPAFVCLFDSRITQEPLDRFLQSSMERRYTGRKLDHVSK